MRLAKRQASQRCVTLTDDDVLIASIVGAGNVSRGLRLALAICSQATAEEYERLKLAALQDQGKTN